MTNEEIEARAIRFNPFADDFGDPSDRVLSDKMVTSRKLHVGGCHNCAAGILKGERTRYQKAIIDGEMRGYRWCWLCCKAMAKDDNGDDWCARYEMGARR